MFHHLIRKLATDNWIIIFSHEPTALSQNGSKGVEVEEKKQPGLRRVLNKIPVLCTDALTSVREDSPRSLLLFGLWGELIAL